MKYLGAHIEGFNTVADAPFLAKELGATAFSFCPVDAKKWFDKPYSDEDVMGFKAACIDTGYGAGMILPHASLILNLCSPDSRKLQLSRKSLADQMMRCDALGLKLLNFHPGSTLKQMTPEEACRLAADSINDVLNRTERVVAVIENTAGQGSSIGRSFEEIADIISHVEDKSRVGVCIDTCHAMAAGYDMSTREGYDSTWQKFDEIIGFQYLRGMHLNDAMKPAASHIDRHASIGKGFLGNSFFQYLMKDPRLDDIPMILETPDPSLWRIEIDWLRSNAI